LTIKGNLVTTSPTRPVVRAAQRSVRLFGVQPDVYGSSVKPLTGESLYGHLGKQSLRFVTPDLESADVEVYKYRPSGLTLNYSFTGGLPCATDDAKPRPTVPSSKEVT